MAAAEKSIQLLEVAVKERDVNIEKLETRVDRLEQLYEESVRQSALVKSTSLLLERKIDDGEQISRKCNLRFVGIKLEKEETPASILNAIKTECKRLDLGIDDSDFDHCHHNGKITTGEDNESRQTVLLKMRAWNARDKIFQNRHRFQWKIYHDLTKRRKELLDYINDEISNLENRTVSNVVEYALADKNCKLKVKAKSGRYYHFNSQEEFATIVIRLQTKM